MSRAYHLFALLFSFLLLGAHVVWLDEPWDGSLAGVNGGAYYGYACQGLEAHGFLEKNMQGPEFFHREDPTLWRPYANHPGTCYFLFYPCYLLFGKDEAALRVSMLIIVLLLLLFFWRGLRRIASAEFASAATMILASLPLLFQYGRMVDISVFCLMTSTPTLVAWRLWREGQSRYLVYFAWAFCAGLMDWFSYFLVPAMWLIDLCESGSLKTRLKRAFVIGLPFGIALITVGVWLIWAKGGLDSFLAQLKLMSTAMDGAKMENQSEIHRALSSETPPLLPSLKKYIVVTNTWPVLVLGALGLLRVLIARLATPISKVALAGLCAGLLPAIVFQTHAAKHEFWFMMTAGALAMLTVVSVLGCHPASSTRPTWIRIAALAVLVLVAGQAAWKGRALHDHYSTTALRDRGLAIQERFGPRDLLLSSLGLAADRFYIDSVMVPGIRTRGAYEELRTLLQDHESAFDRIFILWWVGEPNFAWIRDLDLKSRDIGPAVNLGGLEFGIVEINPKSYFQKD